MGVINSPTFDKQMSIKVDEPVSAMTISACGRDVILASRKGILVVDIDNPYDPPRFLPHFTTWEVADVQSSPHACRAYWIASTSNQKTIVWNLSLPSRNAIEFVLHSHSRAITDINWSAHHPDILATCAIDSYIYCWDLRDTKKPINSYCDWTAGSTQVKWNCQNEHVLASSHGRFLRIWDDRYGSRPFKSICVCEYLTKIYGIDFNRTKETKIITCSLDKSVCFWDYEKNENIPEKIIRTNTPVWRARHTPFGWGVITLPQRDDNSLYLWDIQDEKNFPVEPLVKFEGHTDIVKEFVWRYSEPEDISRDTRQFQLITLSKDHHLRLWPMSNEILESVGHDPKKPIRFRMTCSGAEYKTYRYEPFINQKDTSLIYSQTPQTTSILRSSGNNKVNAIFNRYKTATENHMRGIYMTKATKSFKGVQPLAWMRGVHIERSINNNSPTTWNIPENLGEELSWIGQKFSKVNFEEINVTERNCTLTLNGPWGADNIMIFIRLLVKFPYNYPGNATPKFELEKTSSLSEENYTEIRHSLIKISESYLKKKAPCLEICIRYLLGESVLSGKWISDSEGDFSSDDDQTLSNSASLEKNINNIIVPIPRKCAAAFFSCGKLVCFFPKKSETVNKRVISILSEKKNKEFESHHHYLFESFGNIESFVNNKIGINSEDLSLKCNSLNSDDDIQAGSYFLRTKSFKWKNSRIYSHNQNERYSNRRMANTRSENYYGNIIIIQNISHLEPVKEDLAREYKIQGSCPEICEHNAKIASKYGFSELCKVWTLIKMLVSRIESEKIVNFLFTGKNDINTNLKLLIHEYLTIYNLEKMTRPSLSTKIHWGYHPFGQWLINQIFSYYENIRDVQTLAMLSCVLDSSTGLNVFQNPDQNNIFSKKNSTDYFLQNQSELSKYLETSIIFLKEPCKINSNMKLGLNEEIPISSISQSSNKSFQDNNMFLYNNNNTPFYEKYYNQHSESENIHISPKPFFDPYSTSVKYNNSNKHKATPFEVTLPVPAEEHKNKHSQLYINSNNSVSIRILNYQLDDELALSSYSFFNEERKQLNKFYRKSYAEFLFRWKLYKERVEILKFNSEFKNDKISSNKEDTISTLNNKSDCIKCSIYQSSINKNYILCKQAKFFSNCTFCEVPVKGLASGCTNCSHGGHAKCMENWFIQTKECPTGCGCECLLFTVSKEKNLDNLSINNSQSTIHFSIKENNIKEVWCRPHNITIFKSKKFQSGHID
ncbi:uncharacterized protein T551_00769 [Pneumocystis jirovecii RU7]|uniref:RWD domain-containing protein n=1 Tax=Pneumocystis jirovecii (strain RU7) TaxID=1408657 RepID=A0A0W4ZUN3_PNEJ7|nr:uncharacterized protein T551_00769 [Pneumocystis jirovecii RU7]KTW32087.1 hypothetical protein T551_00769 [Pneumocystis jirovecii RU7]